MPPTRLVINVDFDARPIFGESFVVRSLGNFCINVVLWGDRDCDALIYALVVIPGLSSATVALTALVLFLGLVERRRWFGLAIRYTRIDWRAELLRISHRTLVLVISSFMATHTMRGIRWLQIHIHR